MTAAAGGAVTTALLLGSGALHPREQRAALGEAPLAARGQLVGLGGGGGLSARDIYGLAAPAVVSVRARAIMDRDARSPFATEETPSAGSGFVIDSERGLIVSNAHTVAAALEITVTLQDGTAVPARILGRDDDTDLALLAVDPDGLDLSALEFAATAGARVGDPTLALGGAGGGPPTLTTGVVSATRKRLAADSGVAFDSVIQTDAPLAAGDTGGPLLDAAGRVIGVTGRVMVAGAAVGFAVPAETVAEVVPQLEASGRVRRAFLGIRDGEAGGEGVAVAGVRAASPAERAGMRVGDAVRTVAGEPVDSIEELCRALAEHSPGETVPVVVSRDERRVTLHVRLGDRPPGIADR